MNYILKGRGRGKTTDLIYLSAKTGIPIVCIQTDHILYEANKLKVKIPQPISFRKFVAMKQKPNKIYIDELNIFLSSVLECTVDTVTDTPSKH